MKTRHFSSLRKKVANECSERRLTRQKSADLLPSAPLSPVAISLVDLCLDLPNKSRSCIPCAKATPGDRSKCVLNRVSAYFNPGTLTAIMGPSGSGKTTLLNLISGRTEAGTLSGLRIINGKAYKNADYKMRMKRQGYVVQFDAFLENLTVRETLSFSAMLRMDKSLTDKEKLLRVEKVISEVGLENVADSKVGGITFTGLSGGQKRRLSCALELLSCPSVMLFDEPTSGLDATSSLHIVKTMKNQAQQAFYIFFVLL